METRPTFSRQPARMLLVDVSGDLDMDTVYNLHDSLEHFFAVLCSLSGPVRVPFFGMFALGNYPEALFPLQNVKGNFSRLQSALEELKTFYTDSKTSNRGGGPAEIQGSITQGILEAINMFKRQSQGLLQTAGYWSQLEVSVVTSGSPVAVTRQAEKALKQINIETLKKVSVVCVSNPDRLRLHDELMAPSQGSTSSDTSSNSEVTGLVEVLHIDNDKLSLENLLRGWLHDVATEREHLHIIMPPGAPDAENLILKCDLQERMLSPALTAFSNSFNRPTQKLTPSTTSDERPLLTMCTAILKTGMTIQTDGTGNKPIAGNAASKASNSHVVPVYYLKVMKTMSTEGLCESVLYGMPLLVKATTCWKIDWDELETNQHNFQALCHLLIEKSECLLVKIEPPEQEKTAGQKSRPKSGAFRYNLPTAQPQGHFVLLPSNSGTLLLKSVAVRELLLPYEYQNVQTPDKRILDTVRSALNQLDTVDSYNPLLHECGLGQSVLQQQSSTGRSSNAAAATGVVIKQSAGQMSRHNTGFATAAQVRNTPVTQAQQQQPQGKRKFQGNRSQVMTSYGNNNNNPIEIDDPTSANTAWRPAATEQSAAARGLNNARGTRQGGGRPAAGRGLNNSVTLVAGGGGKGLSKQGRYSRNQSSVYDGGEARMEEEFPTQL